MGLTDLKFKETDFANKKIADLSDTPSSDGMTAEQLKAYFDHIPKAMIALGKVNDIIDALVALGIDDAIVSGDSSELKYIRVNADGAIEVSADGETWTQTASSGHKIYDEDGKEYAQRARLKFLNTEISDDGTYTIVQGLQGPKGDTGGKGDKGDTGDTGEKGEKGNTGSVLVPTVTAAGVISWELQDLPVIPAPQSIRGPQGIQGVQGETGATGPRGAQGVQGVQGVQGIQGKQGEKGETGAPGKDGAQGPAGPQGEPGEKGADGTSFVIQDIYPTLGELKAAFPTGNDNAYQVTAENKEIFIWSELSSDWESLGALQGPTGATGPQGIQGPKGEQGDRGPQGDQGVQGIQGIQGATGPQGETGPQGNPGVNGTNGKSAYELAQEAGYTGTESQFASTLNNLPTDTSGSISTLNTAVQQNTTNITNKVDKVDGKDLSTNDYTTEEKNKLAALELSSAVKTRYGIGDNGTLSDALSKNVSEWTVAVLASGWSTSANTDGWYTNQITVSGMKAVYNPIATLVITSAALVDDEQAAWGNIKEIETFDGYIICKATDKLDIAINIKLSGV